MRKVHRSNVKKLSCIIGFYTCVHASLPSGPAAWEIGVGIGSILGAQSHGSKKLSRRKGICESDQGPQQRTKAVI